MNQENVNVSKMLKEYPDRCPIIIKLKDKFNYNQDGTIHKNKIIKMLVQKNTNYVRFMYILRKKIELNSREAIYVQINKNRMMMANNITIGELYENYKESDSILYLDCFKENTFG